MRSDIAAADVIAAGDVLLLESVQEALESNLLGMIEEFGNAELAALGSAQPFDLNDVRVVGFLAQQSALRSVGINDVTRRQMTAELAEALIAGESDDAVATRVRRLFSQYAITRSRRIAVTTANTVGNFAVWVAQSQSGLVQQRRWVAIRDGVTRDSHVLLHGKRRAIDRPFVIPSTGSRAMHPGGFGIAREDINCRCRVVASKRTRNDAYDDESMEQFDRIVTRWGRRLGNSLMVLFTKQMRDVLSILGLR